MKWITRERVKVDRVACPWLIRKFIDPEAEFLFVPAEEVMAIAEREGAVPYDVKGVELGHHGKECSFDALVKKYKLGQDPAMVLLAPANAADEAQERAELAKALAGAKVTLHSGLQTSTSQGKPISAKFEVEDGKLHLSIYAVKGDGFSEVVINPVSGKVDKAETITDKEDLEHATAQKVAMDKAKITLIAAADKALKSNSGYRVVSSFPQMKADD